MSQKSKAWRRELDLLVRDTGTSLEEVCSYLNITYSGKIGFYNKVPKKRNVFIGIGMAFKLPLDRINEWIVCYGEKKKLYSKDILEDLVWIYLINSNYADKDSGTNYYSLYEECRRSVWETYNNIWNEYISNDEGTVSIGKKISEVAYDKEFKGLREFIMANMDGFKTAYAKPRAMLLDYVNAHKPVSKPTEEGGLPEGTGAGEEPPKPKKIRQASLQTKTAVPLSTEEDIKRYLKGLKEQLMKLLVDHDSVMIIK